MCLTTVLNTETITYAEPQVGYKVLVEYDGHYQTPIKYYLTMVPNTWYEAHCFQVEYLINDSEGTPYTVGFHIFTTEDGAIKWRKAQLGSYWPVVKVEYTRQLAIGYQDGEKTVITGDMKICV